MHYYWIDRLIQEGVMQPTVVLQRDKSR